MKSLNKIALLALISLLMVACTKPNGRKTVDPETNTGTGTEDIDTGGTTTKPLTSFIHNGKKYYDICCDSSHLDLEDSLLSQRVILFSYDQATVESHYRDIIAIHARYLRNNPSAKMILEGHADERGSPEYNLALGERRGKSVANLMRAQGASPGQISVVSFGEEKPVSLCNNNSCWSQNRRVRIVYTAK